MYSAAAIDWISDRLLQGLARGEAVGSVGLRVIVRAFAATGRDDLRAALGPALAGALASSPSAPDDSEAGRLVLLAEALQVADDDALRESVARLAAARLGTWPNRGSVARAVSEVEACLIAGAALPTASIVAAAVDELERVIGVAYEPGEGVARDVTTRSRTPGGLHDQVAAASALLTAHAITDRLPYAMMAEELMQSAVRGWWNEPDRAFTAAVDAGSTTLDDRRGFVINCEAARVLGRLAVLHTDDDYRTMAAVGQRIDYGHRAHTTLARLDEVYQGYGIDSAAYGLALEEWLKTT